MKKPKKKSLWIGLFIIFIMTTSILGLVANFSEKYRYKNIKLTQVEQGWVAFHNQKNIYIPSDVRTLNDPNIKRLDLSSLNQKEKIYLSFNPRENIRIPIAQFLNHIELAPRKVEACALDLEECSDLPVKTCKDATSSIGVILFQEANSTEVSFKDNCLMIQGKDLLKVTDQFILEQLQ